MDTKVHNEKPVLALSLELYDENSDSQGPSTRFSRFKDSFKPAIITEKSEYGLEKSITKRHLRMTALSTGLGTGLLVAAGGKLKNAGPGGLLVAYFITGYCMLVPTINSVSELSIAYSGLPGGFQSYYAKFIDESVGFAIGWNYAIQWISVICLELVVAAMTIKFWTMDVNPDVWVAVFFVVIVVINMSGARGYSEAEFWMNMCKVIMLTGFVIFGLCVDLGASKSGFIGGRYWHDPGAFTSFKGLSTVFVTSAFSLGGSEFISLLAAETTGNIRQAIRAASKLVFFKVTVLFLGSLVFVGLLVPRTNDLLMSDSGNGKNASPYVIAAQLHGVAVLPHIINAVILISVTSVATAAMYSSPRLIQSLAEQGLAVKWFGYIDRKGRPLNAQIFVTFWTFFAFIAAYEKQNEVFTWLLSLSALSFVICWMTICICHLRFRAALAYNNIPLLSLGYVSPTGVIGSWVSIVINALILIAQFWVALWPYKEEGPSAISFFQNYLGAVSLVIFYAAHKLYTRNWRLWLKTSEIDINKNRVIYDPEILELENLEDKERYQRAAFWKKALIFCFD